ncbi:hypothetical protein LTR84_003028 [Exophiala bonariae]|uniref:BZIP domain-containing protein n=1 Tax=Exophiala bonariae TaxID=1690606 RepID=A0AAV9N8T7_9EURO|nr:hypothetical protein LTR84_003028 [Exophiala bonariae]
MFSPSPPQPSLFFAANRPRFSSSYSPNTPSPLRTSRNANSMSNSRQRNYIPRQGQLLNSSPLASKFGAVETKENHYEAASGNEFNHFHTPVDKGRDAIWTDSQLITPPYSVSTTSAQHQPLSDQQSNLISPTFNFSLQPQSSSSANQTTSQWESRARSASPAASIVRHAAEGREKKKSQFLDRIRRRRDDSRAENTGDQVLRMDFVAERKVWEDEMRRRAVLEGASPEIDVDIELELNADMMQDSPDSGHLSPTDEHDVDAAELAAYFEEIHAKNDSQEFMFDDDLDGDEYVALFDQALFQGGSGSSSAQVSNQMQTIIQTGQVSPPQQQQPSFDASMDMS